MSEAEKKIEEEYPFQALREAAKFGYQLAQEELNKNQDELWIELLRTTMTLRKKSKTDETDKYLFDIEEAKKRYRITRI